LIWTLTTLATFAVAFWFYLRVFVPWRKIQTRLRKMAEGDFAVPSRMPGGSVFCKTEAHIARLAERFSQMDRQTADEGLSLRGILSSMQEGILIVNRAHRITLINHALQSFFPSSKRVLGRGVLEFFQRHELENAIAHTLGTGESGHLELVFDVAGNGKGKPCRVFDIHVAPLAAESGGLPQAVLLVFQNVTAIRALEVTRREFVANVSHEFRTPLTIINGYVETLMDGCPEEPEMAERAVAAIHRNVQRLSLLLEDLLAISHLEGRSPMLDFRKADIHEVLLRVLESLGPEIKNTGLCIEVDWQEEAKYAEVDERRIEQVYWNLISNALRHVGNSGAVLRITGGRDGEFVEVAFADNGPGIPLDDQAHIFERFYRVRKDRARDAGGTGLGLSIVKNILLAHGGTVSVQSTLGNGAVFGVRVPVWQGENTDRNVPM
jgi:two-component system, OmpR family, phosphate regulon sensor histidine kinase PhoR